MSAAPDDVRALADSLALAERHRGHGSYMEAYLGLRRDVEAFLASRPAAPATDAEGDRCRAEAVYQIKTLQDGPLHQRWFEMERWQFDAALLLGREGRMLYARPTLAPHAVEETAAPATDAEGEPAAWQWRGRIKGGAWDAWEAGRFGQEVPPFMEIEERPLYAARPSVPPVAEAREEMIINAAIEEYRLIHPSESPYERQGRRAAVRGMMVRLRLYDAFCAAERQRLRAETEASR